MATFDTGVKDSKAGKDQITKSTNAAAGKLGSDTSEHGRNTASGSEFMAAVGHSRAGVGQITKTTFALSGGLGGGHAAGVDAFQQGVSGELNAGIAASRSAASSCATKSWSDAASGDVGSGAGSQNVRNTKEGPLK